MTDHGRDGSFASPAAEGRPVAARIVLAVSLALAVASLVVRLLGPPPEPSEGLYALVDLTDAVVYGVTAWLIMTRRPHPVAWLLALTALGGGLAALDMPWSALARADPSVPYLAPLGPPLGWAWVPGTLALITIVPWLVRRGTVPWYGRIAVTAGALVIAAWLTVQWTDPYPWPDAAPDSVLAIADQRWFVVAPYVHSGLVTAVVVLGLAAAADVTVRWARSRDVGDDPRAVAPPVRGLGWLAIGSTLLALSFLPLAIPSLGAVLPPEVTPTAHLASQLFSAPAIVVAVLGQRLWGIRVAVRRTVVWWLMTVGVVTLYLAAVAGLGAVLPRWGRVVDVLVMAGLAATFGAARSWVQARVDQLIHGVSARPDAVLRAVGRHLEGDLTREGLVSVAEGIRVSWRLDGVRVLAAGPPGTDPEPLAEVGHLGGPTVERPLVQDGTVVGHLVLAPRPGEQLDGRSGAALDLLVPVLGGVVRLALATREVTASRARLVEARDEERRALRRELHDGLGPALAGVSLGLQAVRNTVTASPQDSLVLLDQLQHELDRRVEEVRGLARGLLPPALAAEGLLPALHDLAARYRAIGVMVTVDSSTGPEGGAEAGDIGPLDSSVAGAVYALVAEAVRNVVRHAAAARCQILVRLDGDLLTVHVDDDGVGIGARVAPGVGLQSMKERAEGLGGRFELGSRFPQGTRVTAVVPRRVERTS